MDHTAISKVMKRIDCLINEAKDENDTILELLLLMQSRIKNAEILHRGFTANLSGIQVLILANKIIVKEDRKEIAYKIDQLKNMHEKDKHCFFLVMKAVLSGETAFHLIPNGWDMKGE
jgi:hypothetical protein